MNDLLNQLEGVASQVKNFTTKLNLEQKKQKILELEDQIQSADFWSIPEQAQRTTQEHNNLQEMVSYWTGLPSQVSDLHNLIQSNTDYSEETTKYLSDQVLSLQQSFLTQKVRMMLSGKYDNCHAIFSIHAGAGGTDAQDWAEILLRQYLRYCDRQGLKTDIIEQSKGSEAGIKSVTVHAKGPNAYGLLKSEAGVHRLVRLSPFNPAHTRETSFALLELIPELEEKEALKLNPQDLEIEANTASGHGGQSVNTTYSAIRITHKPTGIKVSIQNERSQHQNKELAMKILLGRLQTLEDEKSQQEKKELRGEYKSAQWGNQVRSYVLHPYKMVKDHRTGYEESDPDYVLNGNLDQFVEKYLETQLT
jgi:peptide chain release factor 2